jgi:hypothetical protein
MAERFSLEFMHGSLRRVSSPLVGRIEEGGHAVLRGKRAATHSVVSPACATPTPARPHNRGRVRQRTDSGECNALLLHRPQILTTPGAPHIAQGEKLKR